MIQDKFILKYSEVLTVNYRPKKIRSHTWSNNLLIKFTVYYF